MHPYLIKATVKIISEWNAPLFTGKLVKSLIVDVNPKLKEVFKKIRGVEPKLIHITPLYELNGRKIKCVYSSAELDSNYGVRRVSKVLINGIYDFYLGLVDDGSNDYLEFDEVYKTLLNVSGTHKFSGHDFIVELISLKVVNIERITFDVIRNLFRDGVMKVIFSSPTMLRDPFRSHKYKSLIPIPLNVFSTPLYIYLILTGRMNMKNYLKTLIKIHKLLNETHSILSKDHHDAIVKVRHIYYEKGKILPAITGYVNYRLNKSVVIENELEGMEEVLYELIKLMATLGTGTSRATGFGHINLKVSD